MGWDAQLETIAQNWANSCTDSDANGALDHNPNRSQLYGSLVGENIYMSSAALTPQSAVDTWAAESGQYDYAANTCAGQPYSTGSSWYLCAHYTQIVWRASVSLGCATAYCPNLTFPYVAVCDYAPAGNVIDSSGNINRPY